MKIAAKLKPNLDDKQKAQKMMDEELLKEFKDLIIRLRRIVEREESIKISPIFRVPDEDIEGLEHGENF